MQEAAGLDGSAALRLQEHIARSGRSDRLIIKQENITSLSGNCISLITGFVSQFIEI
jgi:hypothetical protein